MLIRDSSRRSWSLNSQFDAVVTCTVYLTVFFVKVFTLHVFLWDPSVRAWQGDEEAENSKRLWGIHLTCLWLSWAFIHSGCLSAGAAQNKIDLSPLEWNCIVDSPLWFIHWLISCLIWTVLWVGIFSIYYDLVERVFLLRLFFNF